MYYIKFVIVEGSTKVCFLVLQSVVHSILLVICITFIMDPLNPSKKHTVHHASTRTRRSEFHNMGGYQRKLLEGPPPEVPHENHEIFTDPASKLQREQYRNKESDDKIKHEKYKQWEDSWNKKMKPVFDAWEKNQRLLKHQKTFEGLTSSNRRTTAAERKLATSLTKGQRRTQWEEHFKLVLTQLLSYSPDLFEDSSDSDA